MDMQADGGLGVQADEDGSASAGSSAGAFRLSGSLYQMLLALAVVVGLIVILKKVGGRMTQSAVSAGGGSVVEVLLRVRTGIRSNVVLLKIGHRVLVVGESSSGMRTLASIDEPEELAFVLQSVSAQQVGSITKSFAHWVGRYDQDHEEQVAVSAAGGSAQRGRAVRTTRPGRKPMVAAPDEEQSGHELRRKLSNMRQKLNVGA